MRHKISIHAPPRGATAPNAFRRRSRRKFQFTPLREGRPNVNGTMVTPSDFNSRPSARGDAVVVGLCAGRHISIHAPPRGATRRCRKASASSIISIHAPPRGATILTTEGNPVALNISCLLYTSDAADEREGRPLEVFAQDVEFLISIHAPPRGATGTGRITSLTRMYFNSRPSARGDVLSRGFTKSMIISIHAPPRGATGHLPSRIPRRFYFNSRPSARGDTPPAAILMRP